jgi:asparagine synthase (glutamine-hydrolysing)
MCGICGLYGFGSAERHIARMCAAMVHRGPDSDGFYQNAPIALGMRRLAIIDLSTGEQPIYNEDRNIVLVLNGEVYNYRQLVPALEAKGHHFTTHTDTEAVVHLYEEYSLDCVHHLRGMFAFALWDSRTRTLLLARDRLGIKPLYYYRDGHSLAFASEVRALLASDFVPRRLSPPGLYSYLAYGSVQEPLTLVEGVYSLPPGHIMAVQNGKIRIDRYWDLPKGTRPVTTKEVAEKRKHLRVSLEEAVKLHLVSDVPLGAFLSGGIDSGAMVGLMSQVTDKPVRTFTIGFREQRFDESALAEKTAQRWGTQHTCIEVSYDEVVRDLPQALAAMDQPTVDGINTWYVSRATKQAGVTVALSGLGGDELFAGYQTFHEVPLMLRLQLVWRRFPQSLSRLGQGVVAWALGNNDRSRKLQAFLSGNGYFGHPYFAHRMLFTPDHQRALWADRWATEIARCSPWEAKVTEDLAHAASYDEISAISYLELRNYMLSTLLRDTDCMSMAHSLEVRVPLLDHIVAKRVIGLPGWMKVEGKAFKPLLVKTLDGLLPQEVKRGRKRTFTFPWAVWLRGPLRDEVERTLLHDGNSFVELLHADEIRRLWRYFLSGHVSWARPWAIYVLAKWIERVLG